MEVILQDYKTYLTVLVISFLVALFEVFREFKIKEQAKKTVRKIWGRFVFLRDKIKSYSSSSSSSEF